MAPSKAAIDIDNPNEFGALLLTQNCLAAGLTLAAAFQKSGPSADKVLFRQVQRLHEEMRQMRKEMASYYNALNTRLNAIQEQLVEGFSLTERLFYHLAEQVRGISEGIEDVKKNIRQLQEQVGEVALTLDLHFQQLERTLVGCMKALARRQQYDNLSITVFRASVDSQPIDRKTFVDGAIYCLNGAVNHSFDELATGPAAENLENRNNAYFYRRLEGKDPLSELSFLAAIASLDFADHHLVVAGRYPNAKAWLAWCAWFVVHVRAHEEHLAALRADPVEPFGSSKLTQAIDIGKQLAETIPAIKTRRGESKLEGNVPFFTLLMNNYENEVRALQQELRYLRLACADKSPAALAKTALPKSVRHARDRDGSDRPMPRAMDVLFPFAATQLRAIHQAGGDSFPKTTWDWDFFFTNSRRTLGCTKHERTEKKPNETHYIYDVYGEVREYAQLRICLKASLRGYGTILDRQLDISEPVLIKQHFRKGRGEKRHSHFALATSRIDCAFYNPENEKIYFFMGGKYLRWTLGHGVDDGYPKTIGSTRKRFRGIWTNGIDCAFFSRHRNRIYFFKGNQYRRWHPGDYRVDAHGTIGARTWLGLLESEDPSGFECAYSDHINGYDYFFRGDKYKRWKHGAGVDKEGVIGKEHWLGLWRDKKDAALIVGDDDIYFFKGDEFLHWVRGEGVFDRKVNKNIHFNTEEQFDEITIPGGPFKNWPVYTRGGDYHHTTRYPNNEELKSEKDKYEHRELRTIAMNMWNMYVEQAPADSWRSQVTSIDAVNSLEQEVNKYKESWNARVEEEVVRTILAIARKDIVHSDLITPNHFQKLKTRLEALSGAKLLIDAYVKLAFPKSSHYDPIRLIVHGQYGLIGIHELSFLLASGQEQDCLAKLFDGEDSEIARRSKRYWDTLFSELSRQNISIETLDDIETMVAALEEIREDVRKARDASSLESQ